MSSRWLSPTLFALIALCFLLPFGTVAACGGSDPTASFTGIQIVTRSVHTTGWDGDAYSRHENASFVREVEHVGEVPAVLAFGAAIVGLVLGLLGVAGVGWCALVGVGALLMFLARFGLHNEDLEFDPQIGFKLALLLCIGAGILHLVRPLHRPGTRDGWSREAGASSSRHR